MKNVASHADNQKQVHAVAKQKRRLKKVLAAKEKANNKLVCIFKKPSRIIVAVFFYHAMCKDRIFEYWAIAKSPKSVMA